MRYGVYKALDRTNSLFGIKGTYQKYAIGGALASALAGVVVGSLVNGLVGMVVGVALLAGMYFALLSIQSRFSERERTRWFCSHRLPDYVVVPPVPLRRYCRIRDSRSPRKGRSR